MKVNGEMVPAFEDVVFGLAPGQVSDVFQSQFGFHIAKVFEKRPAGQMELAEVREGIRERLLERARNEAIGAVVDELKKTAKIEVE